MLTRPVSSQRQRAPCTAVAACLRKVLLACLIHGYSPGLLSQLAAPLSLQELLLLQVLLAYRIPWENYTFFRAGRAPIFSPLIVLHGALAL